jgi:glycosyltransferase involved in cell wall biosynthesis
LIILTAGRLVGKKGFVYLLRALPKILASIPQARLVIAGEGPERPLLEGVSKDLGVDDRVSLVGNVPWTQVPAYLFLSDIFVVPSIHDSSGNLDGLPNVILEAMAAGRPIVATPIGGIGSRLRMVSRV